MEQFSNVHPLLIVLVSCAVLAAQIQLLLCCKQRKKIKIKNKKFLNNVYWFVFLYTNG